MLVRPSRIGDFLCAVPAFRALRAALPGAELTVVALPFAGDLVARSPQLDRFVAFCGWPGIAEQLFHPRRALELLASMQAEGFDLAIQLYGSGVYANPFTLMLGARVTAGFVRPGEGPGRLDAALPLPDTGHEVDRALALPRFLGAAPAGRELEFPLLPEDRAAAGRLLAGLPRPLVGVHAGSWDLARRWPQERFAAAGAALRRSWGGSLVVLGGERERAAGGALAREAGPPARNLAGATSLPVLGAVLTRLDVLLTTDSGPAHVAYAVGAPSVTVFRPDDLERSAPPDRERHRAVLPPPGTGGVAGVSVEQVVAAAEELLAAARPSGQGRASP